MNDEPKFENEKKGMYTTNRATIIIFILSITIPFFGFIISFYGFNRAYRMNIGLKYGVLGVVISFIEFLLFTLLFYIWLNNGGHF